MEPGEDHGNSRRSQILAIAGQLVAEEGLKNLSVRKVAARIGCAPSLIYHYFQDKDDLVDHLVREIYRRLVAAVAPVHASEAPAEQRLREAMRRYIHGALDLADEYQELLSSRSPRVLQHTEVLFHGAARHRPALAMLVQVLLALNPGMDEEAAELTAQVALTSTFGLVSRLIVEPERDAAHRSRLVEHFLDILVHRIARTS